jgi:uncharacterized membrane protein
MKTSFSPDDSLMTKTGRLVAVLGALNLCFGAGYFMLALLFPMPFFGISITAFGISSLVLLCIIHSLVVKGPRHTVIFVLISFVVTFITECIGVNFSLWFGDYEYTHILGPQILGVPILIIVCWEGVIYPSHLLVDWVSGQYRVPYNYRSLPGLGKAVLASAATAFLVTAWDLMADPLAVSLQWWTWDFGGEYFRELHGGVPLSNYWGWFSAVFIISFSYRTVFAPSFRYRESFESNTLFLVMLYTTWYFVVSAPLLILGIKLPVFVATFTMGPVIAMVWYRYANNRGTKSVNRT